MIPEFIARFDSNRDNLLERFKSEHPGDYAEIVKAVVEVLHDESKYGSPDPDRIQMIDWGDYQGTLFFVIGGAGYQPSDFWTVAVGYGSCSGCDTLQGIRGYSSDPPTDDQAKDYLTLALHIVQGIRKHKD